jgi:hypothetical protein
MSGTSEVFPSALDELLTAEVSIPSCVLEEQERRKTKTNSEMNFKKSCKKELDLIIVVLIFWIHEMKMEHAFRIWL